MIHNFLSRIYASFLLVTPFIKISYGVDMKEIWLFLSAAFVIQVRFIFIKFDNRFFAVSLSFNCIFLHFKVFLCC